MNLRIPLPTGEGAAKRRVRGTNKKIALIDAVPLTNLDTTACSRGVVSPSPPIHSQLQGIRPETLRNGDHTMQDSSKLRWGWIIAGAFILEIALIILFIPMLQLVDISRIAPFAGIGTFGLGFLVSWWIVRKVPGRRLLHGVLIGILATIIYVGLCMTNPDGIGSVIAMYGPVLFVVGNGLRIVGTTAGAWFYGSR